MGHQLTKTRGQLQQKKAYQITLLDGNDARFAQPSIYTGGYRELVTATGRI
jgi:hypothetical protein